MTLRSGEHPSAVKSHSSATLSTSRVRIEDSGDNDSSEEGGIAAPQSPAGPPRTAHASNRAPPQDNETSDSCHSAQLGLEPPRIMEIETVKR